MSIASEISRLQTAKGNIKTSIENKGVTVPSAATLSDYPSYINAIEQGGGGETYRTWIRPSEWPQYTESLIANTEVIYLTYDCTEMASGDVLRGFVSFYVKGAYQVERGSLVNGAFTAVATSSLSSGETFAELLPSDEGNYVVYRITPTGTAHITQFYFTQSAAQDGYSARQPYSVQTCIERYANLPYLTTTSAAAWTVMPLVSDTVIGLESVTTLYNSYNQSYIKLEHCVLKGTLSSCTRADAMFSSCNLLYDVDLSELYLTRTCTTINAMFANCYSLEHVNLGNGGWDMSGMVNLGSVFRNCMRLREITGIANWVLTSVTTMQYIFEACRMLKDLDLSGWTTSLTLQNLDNAFHNCQSLTELDLSGFTTSGVTAFSSTFVDCTALTSLNLSSWSLASATTTASMFRYCRNLETITTGSSWATSSALKNPTYMFDTCYSLRSIDVSRFVTSSVTDFRNMFCYCFSLRTLDISSFDFSAQTNNGYNSSFILNATYLNSLTLPADGNMSYISGSFLRYCRSLKTVVFPSSVTYIATYALGEMSSVLVYDFRNAAAVPTLAGTTAFNASNTNAKIVVPDSLYDSWVAATNWSSFSSQIVAASDYTE